ncbi:MAG: ABC transporter substrate-binding protein [Gammaproteobacteria bacterium]|nr:ABC transporter substrate-binding protein [Gammaproteobacteria bacterium]
MRHSMLRITIFASLFLFSPWLLAYTASESTPSQITATTQADPGHVIKTALNKITSFSGNANKIHPMQLKAFIESEIIPHFDFNNMSHWITGHYARNMSDEDKADFQRNLRETFLSSLSKHLGSFDAKNTRIRFYPARYRGYGEAFVSTSIYRPDALTIRLDFRMRLDRNDWKIIDIKANGYSAVLYYRRHFMSQLRHYQRQQRYRY